METGRRFFRTGAAAASALFMLTGAGAAPLVTDMPGASWREPLAPLDPGQRDLAERLRSHVAHIAAREHNLKHYQALEQAAAYIEQTLGGYGFEVLRQELPAADPGGFAAHNIEVRIAGAPDRTGKGEAGHEERQGRAAPRLIVVGAHYDSAAGALGANDNASGSAAVIELARLLRQARLAPDTELRLVLFANEEAPYFGTPAMGSLAHAQALRAAGARVEAMLSLETIGYFSDRPGSQRYPPPLDRLYPDRGDFIGFVGFSDDAASTALVKRSIAAFRRHAAFPSEGIAAPPDMPGIAWSDHWAYRQAGFPALMVTDTAPFRYPFYHTAQDTADKLDYGRMARVVTGIAQVILDLGA